MVDLFKIPGAKIIADSISQAGDVLDATLVQVSEGTRDATNPSKKNAGSEQSYQCKGFISRYLNNQSPGNVQQANREIVLLGATLPSGVVPTPDNRIVIEGSTHTIVEDGVSRDPFGATYKCRARV